MTRLDGTQLDFAQIDAAAISAMRASAVPGLGLAMFNNGKLVYLKAYGLKDTAAGQPLTPDSVMTAASLTKPVFTVLVLQLVEQGRLDLDRPVQRYLPKPLPEYPYYQDLASDPRYRQITLRMLLDHGMTRTAMIWDSRFESDFANGYDEHGQSLGPQRRKTPDAAGSMQTTLRDYARFVAAIMEGGLLNRSSRTSMLTPQIRITSAHEFPTLDPRANSAILIMTNSSNGEDVYGPLLEALLRDTYTPYEWEGFKRP